jgi:hypothetical protein
MALAGGIPSSRLNLDAFLQQGRDHREAEGWDKLSRLRSELALTHSRPVTRVHEVMTWVQSGEYDRIVSGEYVRRGQEPGARQEADAAQEFYAERFRQLFREAGESVTKVGEQLSDATERFSEWLRRGRGGY